MVFSLRVAGRRVLLQPEAHLRAVTRAGGLGRELEHAALLLLQFVFHLVRLSADAETDGCRDSRSPHYHSRVVVN
jgi:hypothetical protein